MVVLPCFLKLGLNLQLRVARFIDNSQISSCFEVAMLGRTTVPFEGFVLAFLCQVMINRSSLQQPSARILFLRLRGGGDV